MDETCPICLDDFNKNQCKEDIIKTLSCGHKIHFKCFRDLCFRGLNFFIECPLCREINYNIEKPYKDPKDNLCL